ncbi:flavin-containing monooxygenase [Geodermatophilus sp. CPCC 205761]|uniref:flavin-containing monooxygenase n=1 Tax=Geodermatophilus sp. CPCC 205761 TaxID=2936597 RepID=UPI003EEF1FA9
MSTPARTCDDGQVASGAVDVLVVGAGFAGMYAVLQARRHGFSVLGLEAASGVGGVWYWNRYPGARCDVESIDYSYSFDEDLQRDWTWSERYATQPEILRYAEHVADRYDLRRDYRFDRRVTAAAFDGTDANWTVTTETGECHRARWLVFATGSLSAPNRPDVPGLDDFGGLLLQTSRWPHTEVDLTGRRVGVIGTGSSGVQLIPLVAEVAARLTVFQRTANYTVPVLNRRFAPHEWNEIQRAYPERRRRSWASLAGTPHVAYHKQYAEIDEAERLAAFEARWREGGVLFGKTFDGQAVDPEINEAARRFAERKVREIVRDPQTAEDLLPSGHPVGAKRICTDSGYLETFNRGNVELVNLRRDPMVRITERGVETARASHDLDVLVLATGFDAMTGALTRIDVRGPRGDVLAHTWAHGPLTHLGLGVPGFPNLFVLTGPGSPAGLSNLPLAAEQQVNWLMELLAHCGQRGIRTGGGTGGRRAGVDPARRRSGARHAVPPSRLLVPGRQRLQ